MRTNLKHATTEALQNRYAVRVKARLAKPTITVADARDAMLDCFVATYYEGVGHGVRGVLDIEGGEEQIVELTASMFEKRLLNHDASFAHPSVEALRAVKDEVDEELHFRELPAELRGVHDQVCSLLLAKADGDLPHRAASSVVSTPARGSEVVDSDVTAVAASVAGRHLRGAISSCLREVAELTDGGGPATELRDHLTGLEQLVATLVTVEVS